MITIEEVRADPFSFLGYNVDLFMWAILSAYNVQAKHGPTSTPEQLRDASLDLLTTTGTLCQSPDYGACFTRLSTGQPIHYQGLISPMYLGLHGRIDRVSRQLDFLRFPAKPVSTVSSEDLIPSKIYSLAQLQEQRLATPPSPIPPATCPLP